MTSPSGEPRDDFRVSATISFSFSMALTAQALTLPLLAVHHGYSVAAVGFLTSASAVAQLALRLALPWLLDHVSDRLLIGVSSYLLLASAAALVIDVTLTTLLVAQVLGGGARSVYWTASQTHIGRQSDTAVRTLARLQVVASAGSLIGPAVTGPAMAVSSLSTGLWITIAGAGCASLGSLFLHRLPPFGSRPRAARRAMWRNRGILLGAWTGFAAGGWRGLLDSYVPVILSLAGHGAGAIGVLTAASDGAAVVSTAWLSRAPGKQLERIVTVCGVAVLISAGMLPFAASSLAGAGLLLTVGGAGAGIATAMAPAISSLNAGPADRGAAMAMSGTYRAGARFLTPAAIGVTTLVVPVSVAMSVVGIAMAVPVVLWRTRRR